MHKISNPNSVELSHRMDSSSIIVEKRPQPPSSLQDLVSQPGSPLPCGPERLERSGFKKGEFMDTAIERLEKYLIHCGADEANMDFQEIKRELQKAREDTARLDWVLANCDIDPDPEYGTKPYVRSRAAIDAARNTKR